VAGVKTCCTLLFTTDKADTAASLNRDQDVPSKQLSQHNCLTTCVSGLHVTKKGWIVSALLQDRLAAAISLNST
jgi:hypothetical protein